MAADQSSFAASDRSSTVRLRANDLEGPSHGAEVDARLEKAPTFCSSAAGRRQEPSLGSTWSGAGGEWMSLLFAPTARFGTATHSIFAGSRSKTAAHVRGRRRPDPPIRGYWN